MSNIVIMGMPAAGKGTVCKFLVEEFGFEHVSTGDILRAEQAAGTKLGLMATRIIDSGGYMPDNIMIPMVKDHIIKSTNPVGMLFDGYPRTKEQAKQLHAFLHMRKKPIAAVIYLDVDRQIAIDRILKRGEKEGRADDTPEVVGNRISRYNTETLPLIGYFSKLGMVRTVSANGTIEEECDLVRDIVKQLLNVPA